MSRPGERPLVRLQTLDARRPELETCSFCPKLCRTTCPVSNAEPREALIPWGKMTGAYQIALGDLAATQENAAPSWACTGCLACREACDHRNPVATTLFESRSAIFEAGLAPEAANEVAARHGAREEEAARAARALSRAAGAEAAQTRLLVGCSFLRRVPESAASVLSVARTLLGDVSVHPGCCGLPLLFAGDKAGFVRSLAALDRSLAGVERFLVADAGCAYALTRIRAELGISSSGPTPELLVDLAADAEQRFEQVAEGLTEVLYHDTCALGRGLGRYEAPRKLLRRVLGKAPREFVHSHEAAHCSGAGALLPLTMPAVARAITAGRVARDEAASDAPIVTTCASSLRAFRRAGKVAYDLSDVLAGRLGKP
jgi:Fe-S oxidoreductase